MCMLISFFFQLPADLERTINERKQRMTKFNLPSLPFVIVEGPNYSNINKVYVSFQNCFYILPTVLKAIDVCFALFQVLILKYPVECEHIWLFLQRAVYGLESDYDNIPNIIDLSNKVKRRLT